MTASPAQEIAEIRQELKALRRDSAATLRMLVTLLNAVRALNRHEANIEHGLNDIAKEIDEIHGVHSQIALHCPNCRAPLEHHSATSGDLAVCTACGWSQFVDRAAGALPATFPAALPADINSATPSTWVE